LAYEADCMRGQILQVRWEGVGIGPESVVGVCFHYAFYDVESEVAEYEAWDSRVEELTAGGESAEADRGDAFQRIGVNGLVERGFDIWRQGGERRNRPVPAWSSEVHYEVHDPRKTFAEGRGVGLPVVFHLVFSSTGCYRSKRVASIVRCGMSISLLFLSMAVCL